MEVHRLGAQLMNRKRFIVLEIICPLVIAAFIYLLFRPTTTVVFKLFEILQLDNLVLSLRSTLNPSHFPQWFVYSLPGGLWLLAFQNSISLIKKFSGKYLIPILLGASLTGIGLEFLQYVNITDGRFDGTDLLFYCLATCTSIGTLLLIKNKWQFYTEEKSSPKMAGLLFIAFTFIIYLADII